MFLSFAFAAVVGPAASIPATGEPPAALAPFDELMTTFVAEHGVPGAALAVVKDGKLMLARGYGYAERDDKVPVEPTSLFRIASVSKPITAAAVLKLVEEGKLALDAKAFGLLRLEPFLEPGATVDPRLAAVTILQLLNHTAGFDRGASFDPMFRSTQIAEKLGVPAPAGTEAIIRYMMGRRLDFDPGARYVYSNFGYCVLGRTIEEVTRQSYETYVKEQILKPFGIETMRIGKSLREERAPGEVVYYDDRDDRRGPAVVGAIGHPVPRPYGTWYHESLDAHGGWIASVIDLARFAAAFSERPPRRILRPETLKIMIARPPGRPGHEEDGAPAETYYACGWSVRPTGDDRATLWHAGSLPATESLLVLRHDGLAWAVLFNAHGRRGKGFVDLIDPLLHRAAARVTSWPARDLFEAK
jgi:N-acyl-D-amino-acid deacylase